VREYVCGGELLLQALRRLVFVGGECGDVDEPGNAVVGSRACDDGSAVRVADEDSRLVFERPVPIRDSSEWLIRTIAFLGGRQLIIVRRFSLLLRFASPPPGAPLSIVDRIRVGDRGISLRPHLIANTISLSRRHVTIRTALLPTD
jgi:hypothetical protein